MLTVVWGHLFRSENEALLHQELRQNSPKRTLLTIPATKIPAKKSLQKNPCKKIPAKKIFCEKKYLRAKKSLPNNNKYSGVSNKRTGTLINFQKKMHPVRSY